MILENILKEAIKQYGQPNKGVEVQINTTEDYEIFIRKGFKIYAFRMYGSNPNTFYERWNNYPEIIFSREGLVKQLGIIFKGGGTKLKKQKETVKKEKKVKDCVYKYNFIPLYGITYKYLMNAQEKARKTG